MLENKIERCIAIYCRGSTDKQADTLESQLHRCNNYLSSHLGLVSGQRKVRTFIDQGYSGKDTNRPAFMELMAAVECGEIEIVVFTELSRLSRKLSDVLNVQAIFKEHSVDWISLRERFDTTNPMGNLLVQIMMSLNEFEREQTAIRTRANMLARAERGLWNGGTYPLGYGPDPECPGKLVVVESEAAIVRMAFELYLRLGSPHKVAQELAKKGFRARSGKLLSAGAITYLLRNPVYLGLKQVNRKHRDLSKDELSRLKDSESYKEAKGQWSPIIDPKIWEKAQDLRSSNKRARNAVLGPKHHDYVLSGLVTCGECGMSLEGGGAKNNRYYYYRHPPKKKTNCAIRSYPAEEIEHCVLDRIKEHLTNKALLDELVKEANNRLRTRVPNLEGQVTTALRNYSELNQQHNNLLKQLNEAGSESVPASFWKRAGEIAEQRDEAEDYLKQLQAELDHARHDKVETARYREILSEFYQVYDALNRHEKKKLLSLVIESIRINGRQVTISLYGQQPENILDGTRPSRSGGKHENTANSSENKTKKKSAVPKYRTLLKWLPRRDSNSRQGG